MIGKMKTEIKRNRCLELVCNIWEEEFVGRCQGFWKYQLVTRKAFLHSDTYLKQNLKDTLMQTLLIGTTIVGGHSSQTNSIRMQESS